jgi:hypothetical protein
LVRSREKFVFMLLVFDVELMKQTSHRDECFCSRTSTFKFGI